MEERSISIHAPRAGSDRQFRCSRFRAAYFNPRSPCGERRRTARDWRRGQRAFQSTLPVRGATTLFCFALHCLFISIHAPRAGSDGDFIGGINGGNLFQSTLPVRGATNRRYGCLDFCAISIHAPRAGSDLSELEKAAAAAEFQSTLPVRGATVYLRVCIEPTMHFNPRSPCGERPFMTRIISR